MTALTTFNRQLSSVSRRDRVLARYYRAAFAWPARADSTGVWLRLGDVVDVLAIKAQLGAEVNSILGQSFLSAPVIEVRDREAVWVFLTQPRTPLRQSTWDELVRLGIESRGPGSALRLPPFGNAGNVRWLRCPTRGVRLPPWTAVVGAARSASSRPRALHEQVG